MKYTYLKSLRKFIIFFIPLSFLFFIILLPYIKFHHSIDSFYVLHNYDIVSKSMNLRDGRLITALFNIILNYLHINIIKSQVIFNFLASINLVLASYILCRFLLPQKSIPRFQRILVSLTSIAIIINPLTMEIATFPAVFYIISFAPLAIISSAHHLFKGVMNQSKKNILLSIFFSFISVFIYQIWNVFLIFFIAFKILLLTKLHKRLNKKYLLLGIYSILIYFVSIFINIIFIKISLKIYNLSSRASFQSSLNLIFPGIKAYIHIFIIDGLLAYPKFFILFYYLLVSIFVINFFRKSSIQVKKIFILSLALFTVGYIASLSVLIFGGFSIYAPELRVLFPSLGFIFLMLLGLYFISSQKRVQSLIFLAIIFLSVFNIFLAYKYGREHLTLMSFEKEYSYKIVQVIEEYEKINSVKIEKMAFRADRFPTANIDGIPGKYGYNIFLIPWSRPYVIGYYTGRDFKITNYDESMITDEYKLKDWNNFDSSQIIFKNNTAYITIY